MPKTSADKEVSGLSRIDPRWRIAFLFLVGVGAFFLQRPVQVASLTAALLAISLGVRLPLKKVLRSIWKLWGFAAVVLISYALVPEDPAIDRWVHFWRIPLNVGGVWLGAVMLLRVIAIALASQIARAGDPRAIAVGLMRLSIPRVLADALDAVLALLEGDAGPAEGGRHPGRGRGDGTGGGRGRGRGRQDNGNPLEHPGLPEGAWASLKRIARGDVRPLADRLDRQIKRAETKLGPGRDGAVIAGIALTMLGIRAVKILPSLPFAPGHKLVLLTPLYIVAAVTTHSRFGATLTGLVMGIVAFLLGDGKYGIFELLKHVAPGILCDLFVPLLHRRKVGGLGWSLFGAFIALGRFATILSVVAVVQAPKVAYAMLAPGLLVHCLFGAASGYVTHHLLKQVRIPWESSSPEMDEHTSSRPSCESPSSTGG
jgi:hypothetical protein